VRTIEGPTAAARLDAQIEQTRSRLAKTSTSQELGRLLILHSTRRELFGRVSDLDAMLQIGDRAVREFGHEPYAWLGRAHARLLAHRFKDAEADLERAAQLGATKIAVDEKRTMLYAATGRHDLALAAVGRTGNRDTLHLAREAAILGEVGQLLRADDIFARAEANYQDASPFPLAWAYLLHAQMWERAGDDQRARALFEKARSRLPLMYPAAVGLARVLARSGELPQAIGVLRPFVDNEDPEAEALLAELIGGEAGAELAKKADARYLALFEKYPEAFAEHAAQFWLRTKTSPELALKAAKKNLEARETREAYELALLCAIAARAQEDACAIVRRAKAKSELAHALAPLAAAAGDCR
jgi:tetratricopeptide (TPR) repeat protein